MADCAEMSAIELYSVACQNQGQITGCDLFAHGFHLLFCFNTLIAGDNMKERRKRAPAWNQKIDFLDCQDRSIGPGNQGIRRGL